MQVTVLFSGAVRSFAGGRQGGLVTLAIVDMDGSACDWDISWNSDERHQATKESCGYVRVYNKGSG